MTAGSPAAGQKQRNAALLKAKFREAGLPVMDSNWHGAFLAHANLLGPEMRGSSPLRIERNTLSRQSPACRGLYPVGEGAGFSGGIVSAAVDGLLSAKQIVRQVAPGG